MIGMVNILWRIFGKSGKLEMKSLENIVFGKFNYIDPSGHSVYYEILCGSNFYNSFSSIVEKLNIIIIIYLVIT